MTNTKHRSDGRDARLGAFIRYTREKAELSRADLAEALGVSFQMVYRWEEGTYRISVPIFVEIAKALNVPAGELLSQCFKERTKQ
jgi:transcriptional regulator with XRE-family HTH domain